MRGGGARGRRGRGRRALVRRVRLRDAAGPAPRRLGDARLLVVGQGHVQRLHVAHGAVRLAAALDALRAAVLHLPDERAGFF